MQNTKFNYTKIEIRATCILMTVVSFMRVHDKLFVNMITTVSVVNHE